VRSAIKMKIKFGIREKTILFAVVCLGAVFLWYKLLYLPKNTELKIIKEDLKSTQIQCELLLGNASRPGFRLENEAAVSEKYDELMAKLPERDEIPSAIIQMIRTGKDGNIRILSTKPVTSELFANRRRPKESHIKEVPVDIVLEGKFVDIGRYLFDLTDLPFFGGYSKLWIETSEEIYPEIRAGVRCTLLFLNNVR